MASMVFSDAGMNLLKQFEGLRLEAYKDVKGVWTIGIGHTGKDVYAGRVITEIQARQLLTLDLKVAVVAVNHCLRVPVTQNQFDALVCFAFNVGIGAFATSTLLKDLNSGDFKDAEVQFLRWDHAGNAEVPALLKRRRAEAELFGKVVA